MIRRNLSLSLSLLILASAVLSVVLNLRIEEVSAVPVSPYIMVIPEQTVNSTITPGMNYTISIYTDYDGSDVWGWTFGLTFNPAVLQGLEVSNGDLITTAKNVRAKFYPGTFNNSLGTLSTTVAFFYAVYPTPWPPATTNGPGTLAYVKFRVVDTGISSLTLGSTAPTTAQLQGYDPNPPPYGTYFNIITADGDAGATEPPYGSDHVGHGSFNNIPPGTHDVAVTDIAVQPTALLGDNVPINVTVVNQGTFDETFDLSVRVNTTDVGAQAITNLISGESRTVPFIWDTNTVGTVAGNYVINATALVTDMDPSDNNRTANIEITTFHDIAVVSLQAPSEAILGEPLKINVTVANQGTFLEDVNLTITYQRNLKAEPRITMNTTLFQLDKRPTAKTISVTNWNTTGLAKGMYKINATATIVGAQDQDPSDNTYDPIKYVDLLGHDVAILDLQSTAKVFKGQLATINVTVRNVGNFPENFNVTVTYGPDKTPIGQQEASLPLETSSTFFFIWDTSDVIAASYTINASAWLDTDVNLVDNYLLKNVTVATPLGHIAGTVIDASTRNPIEGANVTISGYFDTTDENGHYNITNVPAGTYIAQASKEGYAVSSSTNVIVTTGQTTILDIELVPTRQDITMYVAIAVIAIIIIVGIAVYLRKRTSK